jgi:hypothetical protein
MNEFLKYEEFLLEDRRKLIFKRRSIHYKTEDSNVENFLSSIEKWIDQRTPPREADKIADFLFDNKVKIKNLELTKPEIYKSPTNTECYRGLEKVSDIKQVIESIKRKKYKIEPAPGYDGLIQALKIENYNYSPRRLAQSWSIDADVPWRFSNSGIILETFIDDNFIMNPEYTSMINKTINKSGAASGLNEEEVIHLGREYKKVNLYIDLGSIEDDNELYPYIKDIL